jgi:hypothetical protein
MIGSLVSRPVARRWLETTASYVCPMYIPFLPFAFSRDKVTTCTGTCVRRRNTHVLVRPSHLNYHDHRRTGRRENHEALFQTAVLLSLIGGADILGLFDVPAMCLERARQSESRYVYWCSPLFGQLQKILVKMYMRDSNWDCHRPRHARRRGAP